VRPEARLQHDIVACLRLCGLTVLQTSAHRARGPLGTTPGVPDLLVRAPDAPLLMWGIEVKTPRGRLSPAQRELAEAGAYAVARSPAEALRACRDALARYAPDSRFLPRVRSVLAQLAPGEAER
jgi:hypothetical protein